MREYMRQTFDEFWVIDLEGNNLGPRKTANVFNIQIPVAIGIGVRGRKKSPETPAVVKYTKIAAESQTEKLSKISQFSKFDEIDWKLCPDDWHSPFLPIGDSKYFEWPSLNHIFPWRVPGAKFHRIWPIGVSKNQLVRRWNRFCSSNSSQRTKLFKETRDRQLDSKVRDIFGKPMETLNQCTQGSPTPLIMRYGYRFLDRQFAFIDNRLGDYIRPSIIQVHSKKNFYFVSLSSLSPDAGPAITTTKNIPDLHFMWGGGKDIIPIYRNSDCSEPNLTDGLLSTLQEQFGSQVSDMELVSYVYSVLSGNSFTNTFWEELCIPGARVPITKDARLFYKAAKLGMELIWLHTYGEQFSAEKGTKIPKGKAKIISAIPHDVGNYPAEFNYDKMSEKIFIGTGIIGSVAPEVWQFSVSNTKIIDSWLGYRKKKRRGQKSSPLDDIAPPQGWSPQLTNELLSLIWIIEATLRIDKKLESVLAEIVDGPCFKESELPAPSAYECTPPAINRQNIDSENFEYE